MTFCIIIDFAIEKLEYIIVGIGELKDNNLRILETSQ